MIQRRTFVSMLAGAAGAVLAGKVASVGGQDDPAPRRIRAVAFDGFVIFDPRPIAKHAEKQFAARGAEFMNLWRTRQFEYCWLRTLGNRYVDFWQITQDSLDSTVSSMKLSLSSTERSAFLNLYRNLPTWPDVPEALEALHRRGIRMAFLSNFSAAMLDANLEAAKLHAFLEPHLTTDRVRAYKPSVHAYQMGPDAFGLSLREIAFAAFAPWDAAGAKWFGYPTVWVNRANAPDEQLGARPDLTTQDLNGLLKFVDSTDRRQG